MSSRTDLLPIGLIARAHGIRGTLRVRTYAPGSEVLVDVKRVYVGDDEREFRVESIEPERDGWLMRLEGVLDRNQADALRGSVLRLPRAELAVLDDDEVYVMDLVGCEVVDREGTLLGHVLELRSYGGQELLVIARPASNDGKRAEGLIPFVEPIVESVDMEARRIVCDPPEGLLDLESAP